MDDGTTGWTPAYFSDRRFPATWTGAPHDWQITEATARSRHRQGKPLVVGWADHGSAHTVLHHPVDGRLVHDLVVEHVPAATRRLLHRVALRDGALVELAVSTTRAEAFGAAETVARYSPVTRYADHGVRTQRRVTPRDPVLYSRAGLPEVPEADALRAWDPVEAVRALCVRLPSEVAALEASPWLTLRSDARERADAAVASARADERLRAMLAGRRPAPRPRLWRRRSVDDDASSAWSVGAERLAELLAEAFAGRRVRRHPDDRSRIVSAPVADGEVTLAVTVEQPPGSGLRVTGLLVYLEGHATTWSARQDDWPGDPADEQELRTLLAVGRDVLDAYAAELATPVRTSFEAVGPS